MYIKQIYLQRQPIDHPEAKPACFQLMHSSPMVGGWDILINPRNPIRINTSRNPTQQFLYILLKRNRLEVRIQVLRVQISQILCILGHIVASNPP